MKLRLISGILLMGFCLQTTASVSYDQYSSFKRTGSQLAEELQEKELAENEVQDELESANDRTLRALCDAVFCDAGRECVIREGAPKCVCAEYCPEESDARRRVCSNLNETWASDCTLHRQRCQCEDDLEGCQQKEYRHMHIDYYGDCQELKECLEEELEDFPRRMREWLFSIMRDMADRDMLSPHYRQLEKKAQYEQSKKWLFAVVWKWCDLDADPQDSSVSRHELFPLRAPLYALEHCIGPFLNSCDPDDDHAITLDEWMTCLQLSMNETDNLKQICEQIGQNN